MDPHLASMFVCPSCRGRIDWEVDVASDTTWEEGRARCARCRGNYPLHQGVVRLLVEPEGSSDEWETSNSHLEKYLSDNPGRAARLLGDPLESLNPADRFVRGLVLEGRGDFEAAETVLAAATQGMYTPATLRAWKDQVDWMEARLHHESGPIVDLATGRGTLLGELLPRLPNAFLATDRSIRVLLTDRHRWAHKGYHPRLSYAALNAHELPLADGSVRSMITNAGLMNIEGTAQALSELRRVVAGELLVLGAFYPEDESANASAIRELGLGTILYREPALEAFRRAGFDVQVVRSRCASARPTPEGYWVEGFRIDGLPVADTTLEWVTLLAR